MNTNFTCSAPGSACFLRIFFSVSVFILSSTAGAAPPDPIKLGATIPLTGNAATYGKLIRDGLELAADELRAGGIPIELILEDVPLPGQPAITALQKMTSRDKIDGLAANFYNGNIPAMSPLLTASRIPAIHTAIADDLILSSGKYIYTTNGTIAEEARLLSDFARNKLHAKTAAILFVGTPFREGYAQHFRRNFVEGGGTILVEEMSALSTADYRAELLRVKKAKPDILLAAYFGNHLGTVLKQLRQIDTNIPVVSVYEAEDPSVIEEAKSAAEGIYFFAPEPEADSAVRVAFRDRFKSRFGYEPRILASNAYDAPTILGKSLSVCAKRQDCVLERLSNVQAYDGASGVFSIGKNRAGERSFTLKTVKDGAFVRVP